MSGVKSNPATKGRIKTGRFFPLNGWKVFWQGVIEYSSGRQRGKKIVTTG
jgi:hypothetical protein